MCVKKNFYDPIFKRVVANDDVPAAGFELLQRLLKRGSDISQFVIDFDPQRLKYPRKSRIFLIVANTFCDNLGKLMRRPDGLRRSYFDDPSCDPSAHRLFAV